MFWLELLYIIGFIVTALIVFVKEPIKDREFNAFEKVVYTFILPIIWPISLPAILIDYEHCEI